MKTLDHQVGGTHYQKFKIQPMEFIMTNELPFAEGNIIKYVCRHRIKNGAEDLKKAIHFIQAIIETEYPDEQ